MERLLPLWPVEMVEMVAQEPRERDAWTSKPRSMANPC